MLAATTRGGAHCQSIWNCITIYPRDFFFFLTGQCCARILVVEHRFGDVVCVWTYSEACRLSRNNELDVSWYSVLTDTRLHPDLTEFITRLQQTQQNEYIIARVPTQTIMDNNSGFLFLYALTVLMAILASKLSTQLNTKSTGVPSSSPPWLRRHRIICCCCVRREKNLILENCGRYAEPDALHKMCKICHCGDVVVVGLKWHIWVDVPVG